MLQGRRYHARLYLESLRCFFGVGKLMGPWRASSHMNSTTLYLYTLCKRRSHEDANTQSFVRGIYYSGFTKWAFCSGSLVNSPCLFHIPLSDASLGVHIDCSTVSKVLVYPAHWVPQRQIELDIVQGWKGLSQNECLREKVQLSPLCLGKSF